MNSAILHPKIQAFIAEHLRDDLAKLILKGSPFPELHIRDIAQQINGKQKAEKKLPTWFAAKNIYYPKKLNLEQSSSEITGKYKAHLVNGKKIIDLTGGFGSDAFFFSQTMEEVTHCELDPELSAIVQHNFNLLCPEKQVHFFSGDSVHFLKNSSTRYDWIYLDPARRGKSGNKVFRLEDCEPNLLEILPILFQKGKHILIKTSPLLDLHLGISALQNVKEIHVVAVENEVKELLWVLSSEEVSRSPLIKTIHFTKRKTEEFSGHLEDEKELVPHYCAALAYLYEPNAAIMKSGLFKKLSEKTGLRKLHPNSHLYTSQDLIDFPGRVFKINAQLAFKPKRIKKELKIEKANISTRNFPKTVAQLKKQLNIKDGGETYLFFTTDMNEQKIILNCNKITTSENTQYP